MASIIKANELQDFGGNSIITSDGSGTVTVNAAAMKNTPAFEAFLSANQSIADNATDKVLCNTEVFDTDNAYDNSTNYRFQPQVAGKYFVYGRTTLDDGAGQMRQAICYIYKNGSKLLTAKLNFDRSTTSEGEGGTPVCNGIIDMNGSSDYIELFAELDSNDGGTANVQGNSTERQSNFGAFKLIGV
jgi:hypothetical protein